MRGDTGAPIVENLVLGNDMMMIAVARQITFVFITAGMLIHPAA
jgi:hypothetical protein